MVLSLSTLSRASKSRIASIAMNSILRACRFINSCVYSRSTGIHNACPSSVCTLGTTLVQVHKCTTGHADMTNTARCSNHCNLREAGPTIHPTNLALTQVAVIAASCCVGHICMVGGGGGCSCMLLLHPIPTSADAAPDLCTLYPDLCTLHLDLWTLCLWCFPSFNWCKYSTCTGGG